MGIWRQIANRLLASLRGFKPLRAGAVVFALVLLAGCGAGGGRHESWPGLIADNGTLYASNLEQIQALNAETGKVYWSFPGEAENGVGPFYAPPVLVPDEGEHGLLIVAGFDRVVHALSLGATAAERPDQLWRFTGAAGQYVATGTVTEDLFIIGNSDGRIYALRMQDGTKVWDFETDGRVWSVPLVIDNTVYVTSLDHHLYALDRETGALQWSVETEAAVSVSPVYIGGSLWIGDFSSTLYQIDLESQQVVWTFEAEDWLWSTPVSDGTTLYFADVSGNVYGLSIEDRTMVWDAPVNVGDVVHGQPAFSQDGSLLFVPGYEKGLIHAIEVEAGRVRASWGSVPAKPGRLPGDLVSDGVRLYAMPIMIEPRVQAFGLAAGDLIWSTPQGE